MADLLQRYPTTVTANTAVTTTTETVAVTSDAIIVPTDSALIFVWAWCQLTTGASTTAVTPRVRRGTLITSTLVGEANAEQVKAAAGSTEPFMLLVAEQLVNVTGVQYVFTVQQTAASADGSILQAGIVVDVF